MTCKKSVFMSPTMSESNPDTPRHYADASDILRLGLTLRQAHSTPGIKYVRNGKPLEELADDFEDACTCALRVQCQGVFVPQDHYLLNDAWYQKLEEALEEDDNGLFDGDVA